MRSSWIWTAVLLGTVFVVLLMIFAFPGSVMRPYVLFWFLLICPGMALIRLSGLSLHPAICATLATGLSIAVDAILAAVLLYAHAWSPSLIVMLVIWFTLACVLAHLLLLVLREMRLRSLDGSEETLRVPSIHPK